MRFKSYAICLCALMYLVFLPSCTFQSWREGGETITTKSPQRYQKLAVAITGFHFSYWGPVSNSSYLVSTYDYKSNSWAQGTAVGAQYSTITNNQIQQAVTESMEYLGYNTKNNKPSLVIEGKIGNSGVDFSHFWSDLGINTIGVITLGSCGSTRDHTDSCVSVYAADGNLIKRYTSTAICNYRGIGTPFSVFADVGYRKEFVQLVAGLAASNVCMSEFLNDLNSGYFDQYIKESIVKQP